MSFDEILRDVRAGKFQPIYFLHGEEPFFIDRLEAEIEAHALSEGEKSFNQSILYGKEVEPLVLLDYLRRYPMMSERQVVILREAQEMKGLSDLMGYVEQPMASTVFVVCFKHKKFDLNTKFGKALKNKVLLFESKRLYDNQLPDWLVSYAKSKSLKLEPAAVNMLAEYLGTDLAKVANEIDKLALNLPSGASVTPAHVQEYVGISKDYNVYELQKAFAFRDRQKVARIQLYFIANSKKNPFIVTIASLHAFFSKVYMLHFLKGKPDAEAVKALGLRSEWFLKDYKAAMPNYSFAQLVKILSILREYDLRSKGVDTDTTNTGEEELMKEMFWKILNAG
ncbi:MAG: DNA polymerase III subunit delta [Lewinellaceae bacterium]|nr:DNA polymerase III subunit delta [Lewinellaceae bacterium]